MKSDVHESTSVMHGEPSQMRSHEADAGNGLRARVTRLAIDAFVGAFLRAIPGNRLVNAWLTVVACSLLCRWGIATPATAQGLAIRHGEPVPAQVEKMYRAGLEFLVTQQNNDGTWTSTQYGAGPGIDGLCCLAILAYGDDPNFGTFSEPLRKGLRAILLKQDGATGMIGDGGGHGSMYHHGFGTLALAEAYGAVDEQLLWESTGQANVITRRKIGTAVELAVRGIITAQNVNPHGGWRYTPTARDADTSVSGANLVALLAARNAGVEVPEENIRKALDLLKQATDSSGAVAYQPGGAGGAFGDSTARTSIAALSLAICKEKQSTEYGATVSYLKARSERQVMASWPYYTRYYLAQALYQADPEAWEKWSRNNTEALQREQNEAGAIGGSTYSTAMSLLSMALSYRFLPIYER